ncbi:nucleotidyltransferase [Streptomyces sp. NPDC048331]|uniref:nucleotidyltransferase domain-containing protein n=1 Tax=Streptomyces sp. NPDC048331 TaxID=3365534 RepID=UPI00371B707B
MNGTLQDRLEVFFHNISLSDNQQGEAQNRAREICRFLGEGKMVHDCFVSGSLSRSTALRGFSDIDLVVTLSNTSSDIRPASIISDLLKTLLTRYPGSEVSENTVRIRFPDGPGVDVLPALKLAGTSDRETYKIPTFNLESWQEFSPNELTQRVREIDSRCRGDFTRLIKLIKWWSNLHGKPIPSFKIEQIASIAFAREMPEISQAVVVFFDAAIRQYAETSRVPSEILEAHATAKRAAELEESGDTQGSIEHWGCLLGDQYPTVIV